MSDADRLKWDAVYTERGPDPGLPTQHLAELAEALPLAGRALDLAGGAGRNALWLARRGLAVTLADVSPVALQTALAAAKAQGLELATILVDLESQPIPLGPWELIVSFHYLQRKLFAAFPEVLAPGGLLLFVQPTRLNLTRHPRPPEQFLLEEGELPRLVQGLEILRYDEGWLSEGRHEARLLARKPRTEAASVGG
jgi:tellurite methyltransferase